LLARFALLQIPLFLRDVSDLAALDVPDLTPLEVSFLEHQNHPRQFENPDAMAGVSDLIY
jgi:hypothetical protein